MAGDLVSAASLYVGEMVSLAGQDDAPSLRAGRSLEAPAGALPPSVLIAVRLCDQGGRQRFNRKSLDDVLQPRRFQKPRSTTPPSTISTATPPDMRLVMAVARNALIGTTGAASRAVAAWDPWRTRVRASWRLG
ncbi:hypothetical protein NRY95_06160 [Xanthomonas campestris pv. phormiicola]|nr:hypothetical protein [Xanthomonas campestris pv. phormiicola]UYC17539.1 hypothetical protein NRY95_06160 [Xanthomonas campestris pv. phormiicola]